MLIRFVAMVAAVFPLFAPGARGADTLESVKHEVSEKWKVVRSLSVDIELAAAVGQGETKNSATSTGKVDFLRKGGVSRMRMEMTTTITMPGSGQTMEQKTLTVADGSGAVYTETDMMGAKQVIRSSKVMGMNPMGGAALFDGLEKKYTLSLLPEDTVNGKAVWCVEGVPKVELTNGGGRLQAFFDKETGLQLKSVILDASGKPIVTTLVKEMRLNPELSEDEFKYTPPVGAQIIDADAVAGVESGSLPAPPK